MQHNRAVSTVLAIAAIGVLTVSTLAPSLAGPKTAHPKAAVTRGKMVKRGAASPLKLTKGTNKPGKEVHRKGDSAATVVVKNQTGWYVDCYIDGTYVGQVGPNAELFPHTTEGSHTLYAVATFTDGSEKTWGPSTYDLPYIFSWSLTD